MSIGGLGAGGVEVQRRVSSTGMGHVVGFDSQEVFPPYPTTIILPFFDAGDQPRHVMSSQLPLLLCYFALLYYHLST